MGLVFGKSVLTIHLELDSNGLLKTSVNGAQNHVQVVSALVDCLKGYMDNVRKETSLIINPNKENEQKTNGGEKTQNDYRRNTSE